MRKFIVAAAALLALVAAGIAAGHEGGGKTAKAVAGAFSAAPTSTSTKTCTTTDGKSIAVTNARYTGTATGDPDLAGAVRIDARSTINTTDGVGTVEGQIRVDVASGGDTVARFSAVYDHGKLGGLVDGRAHDPRARLLGNLSADFSTTAGFGGGKIGSGATGGSAVEVGPASCAPTKTPAEKSEARGTVTQLTPTSITVAGLTCAIPPALQSKVASAVKVNDRAEIHCSLVSGQNTLTKLEKKK
jgi:hypothetical protein